MKRIGMVTGSRAEWGLLKPLDEELFKKDISSSLFVTGQHMEELEQKHFDEDSGFIDISMANDTPISTCKSFGLGMLGFPEMFERSKITHLILLGDRYETYAAAICAYIMRIPIIHIHGGETSGNYDNAFRDAITKMAKYHFPATQKAHLRVSEIKGTSFSSGVTNIFNCGCLGCDGLYPKPYPREEKLLIIYHPNTLEKENFGELLSALRSRKEELIFIKPNIDNGGREISDSIHRFVNSKDNAIAYENLPREEYINLLGRVKAIIGNSSSGIIEAPALGTITINIGSRQSGRERSVYIYDADITKSKEALGLIDCEKHVLPENWYNRPKVVYKGENVAEKMAEIIRKL